MLAFELIGTASKQKTETSQRGEWYNEIAQKTIRPHPRKEMSHAYSVKQSEDICKTLNALQLGKILSDVYLEHLKAIIHAVFMLGYEGKVVNTELFSERHRTSVSHFLNNGKWNSLQFKTAIKGQVIDKIYEESRKSGEPIFCKGIFALFCNLSSGFQSKILMPRNCHHEG